MNQNKLWRFGIVVAVLLWSCYEIYPPTSRNLVQYFKERAVNRDAAFQQIFTNALHLEAAAPAKPYEDLREAIGTNDLARYFPFFAEAKDQPNPTAYILNRLQREAAGKIRLGLDLQGGTSFLMEMDTRTLTNATDQSSALSQAVEVLRRRVDKFGVAEPVIQPQGNDRILVQLPGLSAADQEEAKKQLSQAAFLEFCMVHPDNDKPDMREALRQGIVEPGYRLLRLKQRGRDNKDVYEDVLVKDQPEMTGSTVKNAIVIRGNLGEPEIHFTLNDEGRQKFADITTENVGHRLAIILDGVLYSAPNIREPITGGSGSISGNFDQKEAFTLANVLENPLKAPLRLAESREVSPTIGKEAIKSGVKAAIIGTLAVSIFMIVYYLMAGMVANIALLANIVILLGVMCSIGTTLTLPGIAGIVLTVGMAVDANVLIYERIREETAKGKSLRGAISAGYDRAFGTIFDSHVTTLISSIILIFLGTGPIKGFGVALTIGVAASLFTALVVTRMIFDFMLDRNWMKSLNMLHIIRATNLDFMKLAKPAFITSWLIILVGLGWGIHRGVSVFGVDFRGGDTTTFDFKDKVGDTELRTALESAGIKDPVIQYQQDLTSGKQSLRIVSAQDEGEKVVSIITKMPRGGFVKTSQDHVGGTVGKEIQSTAVVACVVSLFFILLYVAFRYEFSFAMGAVLAIIHDVLMTIGIYCLWGKEFNATTVAAILTIIGFSTNDTIVIFDRIREDLKLGVRGTFREVVNQALNQTLSRTIITSGTVLLATLSLYLFGGGAINDFAFTFLVGVITGTYSSIYIASALVLWWHKGQRPNLGSSGGQVINPVVADSRT